MTKVVAKEIVAEAITILVLFSCKSATYIQSNKTNDIVETAKEHLGTKYKYGGTDRHGMDCSGLVYTSFLKNNIKLPRTSLQQSKQGKFIPFSQLAKGDLLFFKTSSSNNINHVGIMASRNGNHINFIHSSSSKGVIISSTKELYWNKTFAKGKRITNTNTNSIKESIIHKVKSGDTLYGISKKHNTSVQSIKNLNHLKSDEISVGMMLKIL